MKKYEYRVVSLYDDLYVADSALNSYGKEGWLLFNIYKQDEYFYAVFYRELIEKEKHIPYDKPTLHG